MAPAVKVATKGRAKVRKDCVRRSAPVEIEIQTSVWASAALPFRRTIGW